MSIILQLWSKLSKKRKTQFYMLLCLMILASVLEIISISALIPFLGALSSPETLFEYSAFRFAAHFLGISTPRQFLLPVTTFFVGVTLLAAIVRILLLYCSTRLSYAAGADFSTEIYRRTLYQDYSVHTSRSTSEIINGIITKTNIVISKVLVPSLNFITSIVMIFGIISVLIIINAPVALISIFVFGAAYSFIAHVTKKTLTRNSAIIATESDKMVKSLQEGLGGIRDVLIDGTQEHYCKTYQNADLSFRRASGDNIFISSCPRYFMEGVGIVLIAVIAYVLAIQGGIASAIPVLGALAVGAQKLLPALQQAYSSYSFIKGSTESLSDVLTLLDQPLDRSLNKQNPIPLPFTSTIVFEDVSFQYSKHSPFILKGVNLTVHKGQKIGIIGLTGSGKSTLIDLLMGLLSPTSGKILVDGVEVSNEILRRWQAQIAHVSQSIYLSDSSIKANIAFGKNQKNLNMKQIKRAAEKAWVSDVIEQMRFKYDSTVGERGIQLSGGQRQRIGIARALYKNSRVLVFDEATSALDTDTEQSIMLEIENLRDNKTIFIVAHRLTTLKNCDRIIRVSGDNIISEVTYNEIIN